VAGGGGRGRRQVVCSVAALRNNASPNHCPVLLFQASKRSERQAGYNVYLKIIPPLHCLQIHSISKDCTYFVGPLPIVTFRNPVQSR
jgi:hypothetical protein